MRLDVYPGLGPSAGPDCWASRPGSNDPVPPHQGHVTSCGLPPNPEINLPVPRQGVQVRLASSGVALMVGDDSEIDGPRPARAVSDYLMLL
jgi:hypothetical protein